MTESPPFDPSAPVERVVTRVRRHGRRLVLPVLVLVAAAAAAGYFVGSLPEAWMNLLAGGGAIAAAVLLGLLPVLSWLASRSTVTTRRVIIRRGLFVQHRAELPLARVREVRVRRGPLQHLFRSGDIELHSGPEEPHVVRDAPGTEMLVAALHELIERNYAHAFATTGIVPGSAVVPGFGVGHATAMVHGTAMPPGLGAGAPVAPLPPGSPGAFPPAG